MAEAVKNLSAEQAIYRMSLAGCGKEEMVEVIRKKGLTQEEIKNAMATATSTTATTADTAAKGADIVATDLLTVSTNALSVAWAKLTAFMSANPLILLGTVAVGLIGTVYGLAKAYEHFTLSLDEAKEATKESVEKYEEITSEIEGVESKLKDLNNQIDDLDPITDADDIKNLKKESEELERQLSILEEKQRLAKIEADNAARTSLGTTTESRYDGTTSTYTFNTSTMKGGTVFHGKDVTQDQELKNAMNKYDEYKAQRDKLHQELDALADDKKGDTEEFKRKQKEYDELGRKMDDCRLHANELTIAIEEQMAGLSLDSEESKRLYAENKAALDWNSAWLEAIETGRELTEVDKQIHGLNSYFDGSTKKNAIRDNLLDIAETKGKNADLVDELNKMGLTLKDLGLTAEDGEEALNRYFESIVDAANEASIATEKFTMSVSDVEFAFETDNSGADWSTMSDLIGQAGDLYKKGLIGTDDFQSVVQWISPVDVVVKEGERAAEAYTRVWKKYSGKIKRYFDEENPLDSMWNFTEDLKKKSLAKIDGNDISFQFKTTAEAADALGISVQAVDTILHNLEDYGFEFDNIHFSGDLLSEYEKGLNNIKSLYKSLPSGSQLKKNLEGLITGFDAEYTEFEGDLSKLSKEHIVEIEFEYSLAQLEAEIEELQALVSEGDNESRAALNVKKQQKVNKLEEKNNYQLGDDAGYDAVAEKIENIRTLISQTADEAERFSLQGQVSALLSIESTFQSLKSENSSLNWDEFLASSSFEKVINEIVETTGISKDEIIKLLYEIEGVKPTPSVEMDVKQFKKDVKAVSKELSYLNNVKVKPSIDTTSVNLAKAKVRELQHQLDGLKSPTSINVGGGINAVVKADGTFNSFAKGTNVSIDKDQTALVNEVGNEGLVRNGILHKIIGGARYLKLKAGDIIFNHKQMEELEKNGRITSRGGRGRLVGNPSFSTGTINAFDNGSLPEKGSDKSSSSKKKSSTSKSSSDSTKEETSEFFDWLERKIQKLQNTVDKWLNRAEQAFTNTYIKSFYNQASKNLSKLMNTQYEAYAYYIKKANSVGLSDSYKKKVQDGSISISEITDEDLKEKINQYQEYWDKAQESIAAFEEVADQFYNIPLEEAARKIEVFSDAIKILEAKIDNAIGAANKNELIDQQIAKQAEILSAQNVAKITADKNVEEAGKLFTSASGIPSDKKDYVKQHVEKGQQVYIGYFSEGTEAYEAAVRYNEALQARKEASNEYNNTLQETIALERELTKAKFDNIAADYERKVEILDHGTTALDNKIAEAEARGQAVSIDYYREQIKLEEQKILILEEEQKSLEEQLKTIPEGTEEWYDAYAALQDVGSAISECTQNTYKLNKAINEAHFTLLDNIRDEIDRLMDEQEFLREMMSHEKFVDDNGNFTEAGYANLASLTASLEAASAKVEKDKEMIDRLNKMVENGELSDGELTFNSFEELEDAREEYYDNYRDDLKDIHSLEQEIYDLKSEQYKAELDAMRELVDDKKEELDKERELLQVQKELEQRTKNITKIRKTMAAIQGDTSEEGRAKLQRLQVELDNAEQDLEDYEYERYVQDQQDMLDSLYEEYEELLERKLDDFMGVVQEGIDEANSNSSTANEYLNSLQESIGYESESGSLISSTDTISGQVSTIIGQLVAIEESISGLNNVDDEDTSDITTAPTPTTPGNTTSDLSQATQDKLTSDSKDVTASSGANTSSSVDSSSGGSSSGNSSSGGSSSSSSSKPKVSSIKETLKEGSQGTNVKTLQKALNEVVKSKLDVDGIFGAKTKKAVKKFQSNEGISSDGIVGKNTKAKFKAKGYYKGSKRIPYDQDALIHDGLGNKQELHYREVDGALYTRLGKDDMIFDNKSVQKLWDLSHNNGNDIASKFSINHLLQNGALYDLNKQMQSVNNITNQATQETHIHIGSVVLPNAKNYEEFRDQLLNDKKFQNQTRSMTVGRISGDGRLTYKTL